MHHVETCADLRSCTANVLEAAYLSPEKPFVIDVEASACRGLHSVGFAMTPTSGHPFIQTVRAMDQGVTDYVGSPLHAYYQRFRPDTAAAAIGITTQEAHPDLLRPAIAATLPWDFRSPSEAQDHWTWACRNDYRQLGHHLDITSGWKAWGPVDAPAGRVEFARLASLRASIRANGYARHAAHDGDIRGMILRHDDETRIILDSGQHRAAVLVGLGHSRIPVRLEAIMSDRRDAPFWPNVRRGIFTIPVALQIFDRMFAGQPATAAVDCGAANQHHRPIPAQISPQAPSHDGRM